MVQPKCAKCGTMLEGTDPGRPSAATCPFCGHENPTRRVRSPVLGIWAGLAALALLLVAGYLLFPPSAKPPGAAGGDTKEHAGPAFGQSFNVIIGVSGDSYLLEGYTNYVDSRPGAFSPMAVLVVGMPEGATPGGSKFDYGSVVVVEGTTESPVFRLARGDDRIVLSHDVTIFGKKYPAGTFRVPPGGRLTPPGKDKVPPVSNEKPRIDPAPVATPVVGKPATPVVVPPKKGSAGKPVPPGIDVVAAHLVDVIDTGNPTGGLPIECRAGTQDVFVVVRAAIRGEGEARPDEIALTDARGAAGRLMGFAPDETAHLYGLKYRFDAADRIPIPRPSARLLMAFRMPKSHAPPLSISFRGSRQDVRVLADVDWEIECLKSPDGAVRAAAASSLGGAKGSAGAAAALKQAMARERDARAAKAMAGAIQRLGTP